MCKFFGFYGFAKSDLYEMAFRIFHFDIENGLDMSTNDLFRHVYLSTKNYVKSYLFETLLPITHDFSAATAW